jgi:hypothetical protein
MLRKADGAPNIFGRVKVKSSRREQHADIE